MTSGRSLTGRGNISYICNTLASNLFLPFYTRREESNHNPLEMPSSTSYRAETNDLKSVKCVLTKCLAILGCRLLRITCIRSLSVSLSMISTIFSREMKEEINSFVYCLRTSISLLDTLTVVLKENCHKNS